MAEELDQPPLKDVYRKLITDGETSPVFRKYSFTSFRDRMLSNPDASGEVADFLIQRGIIKDREEWKHDWLEPSVPKAPKPVAQQAPSRPVQVPPLLQPAQPSQGPSLTQVTGQQAMMPMAPKPRFQSLQQGPSLTDVTRQQVVTPMMPEPVSLAPNEPQTLTDVTTEQVVTPTDQEFSKQETQRLRNEKRGWMEKTKDMFSSIGASVDNMYNKMLIGERYLAEAQKKLFKGGYFGNEQAAKDEKEARKKLAAYSQKIDQQYANEEWMRNINGSVLNAIEKGQWNLVPEAVIKTVADAALQIFPTMATGGYSMYVQTLPDAYLAGVKEVAEKTGRTVDQVIEDGDDGMIVANLSAGLQAALEKVSGGIFSKTLATKGGYKSLRDFLIKKGMGRLPASGVALGSQMAKETGIEVLQEGVGIGGEQLTASNDWNEYKDNLYNELQTPEAQKRLKESAVGGFIGAGGLIGGGRFIQSWNNGTLLNTPVTGKTDQKGDFNAVVAADAIESRTILLRQKLAAIKADPQNANQIAAKYDAEINKIRLPSFDQATEAYLHLTDRIGEGGPQNEYQAQALQSLENYIKNKGISEKTQDTGEEPIFNPMSQTASREPIPTELGVTPEAPIAPVAPVAPIVTPEAPVLAPESDTEYVTATPEELEAYRNGTLTDQDRIAGIENDAMAIEQGAQTLEDLPDDPNYREMVRLKLAENQAAPAAQQGASQNVSLENRVKETENKIKNKNLFLAEVDENGNRVIDKQTGRQSQSVGEIISQSDDAPVPTSVREINGIEFVEFSNPRTGDVDVIVTGKNDGSYVGYYRLYNNGKPTNQWSSKFENPSRNKEDFKTMISGVQSMLPEGHEYTEKTSISTDGLRVWNQQLNRGYQLQYDGNGNLVTNKVAINGDAIVNELGIDVDKGSFENISVRNNADIKKVKQALLPYLQKLGLNESNLYFENGTVYIDLPVLKKPTNQAAATSQQSNETTTTTTPSPSVLGETTEATGQTGGGVGTDVSTTQEQGTDQEGLTDAEIESRMSEIEGDKNSQSEFNALEREMEKRERALVFEVPLDRVSESVDAILQKDKDKPNGFGSFIDKRDARETKQVAERYLNADKLTEAELMKDFSDAVRGNPMTWYADGLKLREALGEATRRGIDTEKMLANVVSVYTDAGYSEAEAKSVVGNMLAPIFNKNETPLNPAPIPVAADATALAEEVAPAPVEEEVVEDVPEKGQTITVYGGQKETIVDIKDGKVYATPEGSKTKNIYSIEDWNEMSGKQDEINGAIAERDAAFEESQKAETSKKETDNDFDGFDKGLSPIEKGKVAAYLNKQAFGKTIKAALKSYAEKGAYVKNGKIVFDENGQTIQIDNKYQTKTGVDYFNHVKAKVEPTKSAKSNQTVLSEAKAAIDKLSDEDVVRIAEKYYVPEMIKGQERETLLDGYWRAKSTPESARSGPDNRIIEDVESISSESLFDAFATKGESGRKARAELKETLGKEEFARLESIHKKAPEILKGLEERGVIKIECP